MPISLSIQTVISLIIFEIGIGTGFSYEHAQVKLCENSIILSNAESKNALASATNHVQAVEQAQTITDIQLEAEHAKNVESNRAISDSVNADMRVWSDNKPRCSDSLPKTDITRDSKPSGEKRAGDANRNNGSGFWLSTEQIFQGVRQIALEADDRDAICHEALIMLKHAPEDLIK
jgi:hypothetical protein